MGFSARGWLAASLSGFQRRCPRRSSSFSYCLPRRTKENCLLDMVRGRSPLLFRSPSCFGPVPFLLIGIPNVAMACPISSATNVLPYFATAFLLAMSFSMEIQLAIELVLTKWVFGSRKTSQQETAGRDRRKRSRALWTMTHLIITC